MGARTVQNPEEMIEVLWMFFIRNIMRSLVETNKRSATDIYRLLQMVKDDPTRLALVMGVLDDTHYIAEFELKYPDWMCEHLTSRLEATSLRNPGIVELWREPCQTMANEEPDGHDVYNALKVAGLLERAISFGDLKFFEGNPKHIPVEWRGKKIYGWASVARGVSNSLLVPCLVCTVSYTPYMSRKGLDLRWLEDDFAGLRKSV